jgi:hypothetical protein
MHYLIERNGFLIDYRLVRNVARASAMGGYLAAKSFSLRDQRCTRPPAFAVIAR